MKTTTASYRALARTIALVLAATTSVLAVSACAAALGIEDTKLDPLAGGAGAGGGGADDPCYVPVTPIIWQFSRPIVADTPFPLLVLSQKDFEQAAEGARAPADGALLASRSHVVVDARGCNVKGEGPAADLERILDARLEIVDGLLPEEQDSQTGAKPFSYILGTGAAPKPNPPTTSVQGLAGFINLLPGNRTFRVLPPEADGLAEPSAERFLVLRRGALTTIRMEPNENVAPYSDLPEGSTWACAGKPTPAATVSTATITAVVIDITTALIPAGVEFRVCKLTGGSECLDPAAPAFTVKDGYANIPVDVSAGGFNGYLYVTGKLPRANAPASCGFGAAGSGG